MIGMMNKGKDKEYIVCEIDVWKEIIRKPCKKCKQPTQTIVDICCNCNFPKGEK